jgi:hypothetical protein
MSNARSLDVHVAIGVPGWVEAELAIRIALEDAIDLASDQDQMTWLTDHGKRIAAIVPVDVAERYAQDYGAIPRT